MEDKDQLMEELENARQAGDDDKVIELESILRGMGIKGFTDGGNVFPDLTGDGKVTKKDILRGRGVEGFSQGGGIAVTGTKYRGTF